MKARRIADGPLVVPAMGARLGRNVNGPSLIEAPAWVDEPLGRFYLYFAHHAGDHIRLAVADALAGPWRIHEPGVLDLRDSLFPTARLEPDDVREPLWADLVAEHGARILGALRPHIASPDVHVDAEHREIRMYYHGLLEDAHQKTRVALSRDGLHFEPRPELLGLSYFRVFRHRGYHYAIAARGTLYRSADGLADFEEGPEILGPNPRHAAVRVRGDELDVFFTRSGDAPERILHGVVRLEGDWRGWRMGEPADLLRPERDWEGAGLPVGSSQIGLSYEPVNQLRDPAIFQKEARSYLLYSVAGEQGIALAELIE